MKKLSDKNVADIDAAINHTNAFREAGMGAMDSPDSPSRAIMLINRATSARMALDYLLLGFPADASVKMADSTDDCVVKGHDLYTAVKYLREIAKNGFFRSLPSPAPQHERNAVGFVSDAFVRAMNAGAAEKWVDVATLDRVAADIKAVIERGWNDDEATHASVAANVLNILDAANGEGYYSRNAAKEPNAPDEPLKPVAYVTTAYGRQPVYPGTDMQVGPAGRLVYMGEDGRDGPLAIVPNAAAHEQIREIGRDTVARSQWGGLGRADIKLPPDLEKLRDSAHPESNTNFDGDTLLGVFEASLRVFANFQPTPRAEAARYIMRTRLETLQAEAELIMGSSPVLIGKPMEEAAVDFMKTTVGDFVERFQDNPEAGRAYLGMDLADLAKGEISELPKGVDPAILLRDKSTVVEVGAGQMGLISPGGATEPQDGNKSPVSRSPGALWHKADPEEVVRGLDASPPEGQTVYFNEGWDAVRTLGKCLHVLGGSASAGWQAGFAAHMAVMPSKRVNVAWYNDPERLAYGEGFAARLAGVMIKPNHHGKADDWDSTERACPYGLNAPGSTTRRNAWFDGFNDAGE